MAGHAELTSTRLRPFVTCTKMTPENNFQANYSGISLCGSSGPCHIELQCPDNAFLQEYGHSNRDCFNAIEAGVALEDLNQKNCNTFGREEKWLTRIKEREILYDADDRPIGARISGEGGSNVAIFMYVSCEFM